MPGYVALLRGVGPTLSHLSNPKVAAALQHAGLTEVRPLLASGNFVFAAPGRSTRALERRIRETLRDNLGAEVDVFVRSASELATLVARDPFKGAEHGREWYLTVTFRPDGPPVFTKLDRRSMDGPQFMTELERKYGRHITTRTWNTVLKIVRALEMPEKRVRVRA